MASTALDSKLRRCATAFSALALLAVTFAPAALGATGNSGRAQIGNAESILLEAANRDRTAHGLAALQWDEALANAARGHAELMARRNALSHQFTGEAPLQDRARQAGARFHMVAENVAEGPNAAGLHVQWMDSPGHRANLLDAGLNAVGIAVVQSGGMLFAVEDFAATVATLSLGEQEHTVGAQLAAAGLVKQNSPKAQTQ